MALTQINVQPPPDAADAAVARLVTAARELAAARSIDAISAAIRRNARAVTGADGVTFVLREGELVHYADEDAVGPLWKGRRFPVTACISGWAMLHRQTAVVEDVFADDRLPHDAYRPTFVRSLAMVPVVADEPVAAIGAYWARRHRPTAREIQDLESLAGLASVSFANARLEAELRGAIRARDEFIAVASHELRSPLSAAKLQVELAARGCDGAPEQLRTAVTRARRSLGRLGALVERLLDVSLVAERQLELARAPASLAEIARAVVDRVCDANPSAALELVVEDEPRGEWDRSRLEQVVDNLASNAVKFGAGAPVTVRVARDGPAAVLSVSDRGIGIAPEHQARIFELFERAVDPRHYGGLGLGLWISREIVEAHGGTLSVESRPGAGATFEVRLPTA